MENKINEGCQVLEMITMIVRTGREWLKDRNDGEELFIQKWWWDWTGDSKLFSLNVYIEKGKNMEFSYLYGRIEKLANEWMTTSIHQISNTFILYVYVSAGAMQWQ